MNQGSSCCYTTSKTIDGVSVAMLCNGNIVLTGCDKNNKYYKQCSATCIGGNKTASDTKTVNTYTCSTPTPTPTTTPACFLAGTKIMTIYGYKDINKLKVGDRVLSYNEKTGKNEYQNITNVLVFENKSEVLYTLTIDDGNTIKATEDHRFYTYRDDKYQFIAIKKLHIGDVVQYADGTHHKIINITNVPIKETVYNLTIDNNHNFYVGKNGILTHNMGQGQCTGTCGDGLDCDCSK